MLKYKLSAWNMVDEEWLSYYYYYYSNAYQWISYKELFALEQENKQPPRKSKTCFHYS